MRVLTLWIGYVIHVRVLKLRSVYGILHVKMLKMCSVYAFMHVRVLKLRSVCAIMHVMCVLSCTSES